MKEEKINDVGAPRYPRQYFYTIRRSDICNMLPLLPPEKKGVSLSTVMAPEVSSTDDEAKEDNPALMAAAEDLIKAVHSKDAKAVATALESAFMECDNDDSGEAKEGPEAMCGGGMAGMLGK